MLQLISSSLHSPSLNPCNDWYWLLSAKDALFLVSAYSPVVHALTYSATAPPVDLGSNLNPGSFANPAHPSPLNTFLSISAALSSKKHKKRVSYFQTVSHWRKCKIGFHNQNQTLFFTTFQAWLPLQLCIWSYSTRNQRSRSRNICWIYSYFVVSCPCLLCRVFMANHCHIILPHLVQKLLNPLTNTFREDRLYSCGQA